MNCRKARHLLHVRLDGELGAAEREQLDEHLEGCPECAATARQLNDLTGALREGFASLTPPASLVSNVASRLTDAGPSPRVPRRCWMWGGVAAALLLVVGLTFRLGHPAAPAIVAGDGLAHVFDPGAVVSHTARAGEPLWEQSVVWGADDARVYLRLAGGARLALSGDAVIRVGRGSLALFKGGVEVDLRGSSGPFALATPWGVFRADRAVFSLVSAPWRETARLEVTAGAVRVSAAGRERVVEAPDAVTLPGLSSETLAL